MPFRNPAMMKSDLHLEFNHTLSVSERIAFAGSRITQRKLSEILRIGNMERTRNTKNTIMSKQNGMVM